MTENNILANLPAPVADMPARNLPVPADIYRAPGFTPEPDTGAAPVPLSHYIWILRRNWWKILLFVACSVTATVVVSSRLIPIYESTATVNVDFQAPSGVVGQNSTSAYIADPESFLTTQTRLIQSDAVLRPVAEQFHLKIYVDMVDTPAFHSEVIAYPAITIITRETPGATRIAHRPAIDPSLRWDGWR